MTPLEGVRILDLSRILAGPWCTQLLSDLGAEVIKIEHPDGGDDTRRWGPPWVKDGEGQDSEESAYFHACNRGKRLLALDFTQPEGRERLLELAAEADVLIENYKVGGLAKYGLDYASLSARVPGLVYCSITGYGQTGPYAHRPGYDAAIQAIGGLMSLTGERDERPGGGPQKVGVAVADLMAGMYAATSILAALRHRDRTGQGQHLDVSLLDCQVAWLANQASNYLNSGIVPGREGSAHPNIVPYQRFATADGFLMLAVGNDRQFARLAEVIGQPALATDLRYATNPRRVQHRTVLVPQLESIFATRSTAQWLAELEAAGVPAAPINDLAQVFADPQVRARGLCIEAAHPNGGTVRMVRHPVRWSLTPPREASAPMPIEDGTSSDLAESRRACWRPRKGGVPSP